MCPTKLKFYCKLKVWQFLANVNSIPTVISQKKEKERQFYCFHFNMLHLIHEINPIKMSVEKQENKRCNCCQVVLFTELPEIKLLFVSSRDSLALSLFFKLGIIALCQVLSHVLLFATPWTGSSVHGILQARILEWISIPFSRRPS